MSQEDKVPDLRGNKNGEVSRRQGTKRVRKSRSRYESGDGRVHMASEGLVGTQGAETAPLSSVVHTPTQDSTASTPIQPIRGGGRGEGGYTLPPEPHLAGNRAPLSHVLDEGQELLLSPGQVEEKKLWQPD